MPAAVPERFVWATGLLDIQPGEELLEIGCGAGIWAEQIASRLRGGMLTALDRSEAMMQKAAGRNREYIQLGKVALITGSLADWKTGMRYDKIVSFNVNLYPKGLSKELNAIHELLRPGGQVYCFYEAPFNATMPELTGLIAANLRDHAFRVEEVSVVQLSPRNCCCITARQARYI